MNHDTDPTADLAATLIGGHLALLELRRSEQLEPFDAVYGPAELPARHRHQAASCKACKGDGHGRQGYAGHCCPSCDGTGYDPALYGYALFSPDGERLSDTTGEPAAIVLAAAACHQAASWLGEPVLGGFALIRKPTGQPVSAWQRQQVDR